jgi:hypothetical protein
LHIPYSNSHATESEVIFKKKDGRYMKEATVTSTCHIQSSHSTLQTSTYDDTVHNLAKYGEKVTSQTAIMKTDGRCKSMVTSFT